LLLICIIGEAKALANLSWIKTVWKLLTCSIHIPENSMGLCPQCDYNLFGLTQMRCPECGRPFTFEEVGATPAELGFTGTIATDPT
jgi:hypothetical protein